MRQNGAGHSESRWKVLTRLSVPLLALLGVAGVMWPREMPAQGLPTTPSPLLVAREPAQIPAALLPPTPSPVSLTASDGTGLELVSMTASAVIEDPLAFTELRLVFRNPESRTREGRFRITLPSGATISRFAMRIGDRFQEGEVVEQQAARVAYEDFLHRRQDPALLEAEAGNEFSARVFPIPPNSTKELIVSYSQELTRRDEPYRLPLRGLPHLGSLSIRALVSKTASLGAQPASNLGGQRAQHEVIEVDKRNFMPDRDFEVAISGSTVQLGLRHDNLVAARIVPVADAAARDAVTSLFVLVDTSASRALGLTEQISALEGLLSELARSADVQAVTVASFDQEVTPIYSGKISNIGDRVRSGLLARRALGASDLDGALGYLVNTPPKLKHTRVLLVSDGVATAGETSADKLRARVKALSSLGVERLDVLAVGGIRDDALLARLVTSGLARDGVVLDATRPSKLLAQKLTRATRSGIRLAIDGAGWVWPSVLDGVQPGDELVVYADLPADKPFQITVDDKPLALAGALSSVERPLLERAWVKARINKLIEQRDNVSGNDRDLAEALKKQAIELSTKHRVLSPYTSLLVLETEQDYARFGIERRALADILTVGAGGIALMHRADFDLAQPVVLEMGSPQVAAPSDPAALAPPQRTPGNAKRASTSAPVPAAAPASGARHSAQPERSETYDALSDAPSDALSAYGTGAGGGGRAAASRASTGRPDDARRNRAAPAESEAPATRPAPPQGGIIGLLRSESTRGARAEAKKSATPALEGELKQVLALLSTDKHAALKRALAWRARDAGDVLALVALGECFEALSDLSSAARAYGSIIDLFPGRADMRRFAGERLERVKSQAALTLAVDTYRKAVEQRPDHPASHRLLGFALLKLEKAREAFEAILVGVATRYPDGRFRGVEQILREDLGLAGAVWMKQEPALQQDILSRLQRAGGSVENTPSLRFVLNWETDANDVDFHIHDSKGGHAYYSAPTLPSGGKLYADVTTGYGPECFTIRGKQSARAYPYKLQAHYYSRGPMGYGMGKLQIIDHDGQGTLRFEERPFVVMESGAYVELGTVHAPRNVL